MSDFDEMKLAVESLSGGKNTVIFDDVGMPSIMVVLPKMISSAICEGAKDVTHPAFIVDGVEKEKVAISKYHNIVVNGRAYSLPMKDPEANISWTAANEACIKKGEGWCLTPFSLLGAVALWCKKNGTMPQGNNNYGKDYKHAHERGVGVFFDDGKRSCRIATGSGPATWNHDYTQFGIADLNGNVFEWGSGIRLVRGEIQIIPYANCAKSDCDMSVNSKEWKAIKADGSLVEPGTNGTLKYDIVSGKVTLCTAITTQENSVKGGVFENMTVASGVTAPQLLKELALFPADSSGYEGDYFWVDKSLDEAFVRRGGSWYNDSGAGVFATDLNHNRSESATSVGFRSAFYGEL